MKKATVIISSLILSLLIVFAIPRIFKDENHISANVENSKTLVKQEILSYSKDEKVYNKIYHAGELIGVVSNLDYLNNLIKEKYKDYEKDFPNTELGLGEDVYTVEEKSFAVFENVDDEIMNYLTNNDLLGVKTTSIEFSTTEGVFEIIYVKNYEDFSVALERFFTNFVSEETLQKLLRNETIETPTELGVVETNLVLTETINQQQAVVSPSMIFSSVDEIYEFLCYGRNSDREYYTVKEGDTLQGVGYYFGDMSTRQLVMINPNVLYSENQVVTPGMELNVTYFKSPLDVVVTKENLSQQYFAPEVPIYIEDEELEEGIYEIRVQEELGIKNVLYEEKWINGVLTEGNLISENIIKQPKQGVIAVGTKQTYLRGTGQFIWPVDNPFITCHYGCYPGHTGTDIINRYVRYADVYAMDSGIVDSVGYQYDMGYYCIINHRNGIRTMYMHFNVPAYVEEGQNVTRGQIIGQMGNTGSSEGVHVHVTFEVDGYRVNACNYLPCSLLY